jgi:GAF domain-containing protein
MNGWQSEQAEVAIKVARLSATAMERLRDLTRDVRLEGQMLRLRVVQAEDLPEVVRCLVESGAEVFSVIPQRVSLEELFLQVTGPELGL